MRAVTSMTAIRPPRTPLEPWVLARAGARDVDGLRAHQLRLLRATVARVRECSPFYAGLLRGTEPDGLECLGDLARLPFTTPEDLQAHGMRLLCVRPAEIDRIVTLPTSGTTGEPKRIHFTAADQELTRDFFHHGMSVLVRPGQRVCILLPGERPGSVGDLLRTALARMDVDGVVHGPVADTDGMLRVLAEGRFDCVVGIPVQVLGLARRGAAAGARICLDSVLLSTDHAPRSVVAAIETAWGCRVFDHYGSTEMGLGGGVECEARDGYHLRESDLLFEVVDPETGMPVPDGAYGEVIFTTLTREAMPLVRYRTGDRGRFLTEPCPCGTVLRRLERVRARYCGRASLRAGGMLDLSALDEPLFALPGVLDVRARLVRAGAVDVLSVEVLQLGEDAGLLQEAESALAAAPVLAGPIGTGLLRVDFAAGPVPWPQGVGTIKRTLVLS
jgi:phenylacetate-coenzyme A ligase PaaK-like adenylate-forming protein